MKLLLNKGLMAALAVAARVLTREDGQDEGKVYEITGPEALSYSDIARTLSDVLGRPVQHVPVDDAAARLGMLELGMPEWLADALVALNRLYRAGRAARVADTVERIIGRPPRPLAAFLHEHAPAFQG